MHFWRPVRIKLDIAGTRPMWFREKTSGGGWTSWVQQNVSATGFVSNPQEPSAFISWAGLSGTNPVVSAVIHPLLSREIQWSFENDGVSDGSKLVPMPGGVQVNVVYSSGIMSHTDHYFPPAILSFSPTGGTYGWQDDTAAPPVGIADLVGKQFVFPFTGNPLAEHTIKVGDKEWKVKGDTLGFGSVSFKVPTDWDGSVTFDGKRTMLTDDAGYQGEFSTAPTIIGNIYGSGLPPGMSRYTPGNPIPLPAGMTPGAKVPLPEGMSVAPVYNSGGGQVGFQVSGGGSTSSGIVDTTKPAPEVGPVGSGATPPNQTIPGGGNSSSANEASGTKSSGLSKSGMQMAEDRGKGDGVTDVGETAQQTANRTNVEALRAKLKSFFTMGGVLTSSGIPRYTVWVIHLDGPRGLKVHETIQLDSFPFRVCREALRVWLCFVLGIAFFKFCRI